MADCFSDDHRVACDTHDKKHFHFTDYFPFLGPSLGSRLRTSLKTERKAA
jgi:hypothetical protein